MRYEVEVDTSLLDPTACAGRIIERMRQPQPPTALYSINLEKFSG